ncbi:hypothetical protein [Ruminiclostridium papyrosolvens]|uniref:Uncharacterized protein n=1 Tax=Ruminiclostridium papyrosolvens C7 TaxID=1330534 RepID=U4QXL1_9FIRM|nr:hypothetical protein [Ruminiclostridium papyrosolvens]EPR07740.1 hypothetical protein L323_19660 [Ruminiclostridium papyrosolvens C7]
MKYFKKVIIPFLLIVCMLLSSLPVCAAPIQPSGTLGGASIQSLPSEPSGVWYAPYGGTWNVNNNIPASGILRPQKIVYITYDQLALIQANKLTSSDLYSLARLAIDKGISYVLESLTKKLGSTIAKKFVPYIGNAILAYDFFNGLCSFITDARFAQAISRKHGIAISTGFTYTGISYNPYTAYDDWSSTYVYNPTGCVGTFTANNN